MIIKLFKEKLWLKRRKKKFQPGLCPTALSVNSRNVPVRMSCAQLVQAHCGRPTRNKIRATRSNQTLNLINFHRAGWNNRFSLWFESFFCVLSIRCRTSEDRRGCGTTGPQILQCRWVHGCANTHSLCICTKTRGQIQQYCVAYIFNFMVTIIEENNVNFRIYTRKAEGLTLLYYAVLCLQNVVKLHIHFFFV